MGNGGMIRAADVAERQGIGRGSAIDQKHAAVGLEQRAQAIANLRGPGIVAVAGDMPLGIGAQEGLHRLRTHAGVVIRGELLGHADTTRA